MCLISHGFDTYFKRTQSECCSFRFLQLVSEFILLRVRPEDAGVFHCSASNPAGVATANITIEVVEEEAETADGSGGLVTLLGGEEGGGENGTKKEDGRQSNKLEEKQARKEGEEEEEDDSMIKVGGGR